MVLYHSIQRGAITNIVVLAFRRCLLAASRHQAKPCAHGLLVLPNRVGLLLPFRYAQGKREVLYQRRFLCWALVTNPTASRLAVAAPPPRRCTSPMLFYSVRMLLRPLLGQCPQPLHPEGDSQSG